MSAHDWAKECAKHFDVAALFDALDVQRRDRGALSWQGVAREL